MGLSDGKCNDPTLACATINVPNTYRSPTWVAGQLASLTSGQWLTLQTYILVKGSRPGMWDCTSPDWHAHWTDDNERYCYDDLHILNAIPSTATVTDPKTVAVAWGRTNYTPPPP